MIAIATLTLSLAACGDSTSPTTGSIAPMVVSSTPASGATGVALNGSVSATFSEPMDPASLTAASFTLAAGGSSVAIPGTVIYSDATVVFWPAAHFTANGVVTATITTDAVSSDGVALAADHTWSFTAGAIVAPGQAVRLGSAGGFAILAKSGLATVPTSAITGDLGISPAAASYITGFALTAATPGVFATSPQVTGKIYAADYASPTPSMMTTAIGDMELAFTDAAGRAPDTTELGAGNIGGMTLVPGVYKWTTGVTIPTSVTLSGDATAVWIFQIAQDLTTSSATRVVLTGGALAKNVFWQVAGHIELGTTSHVEGILMAHTSITLGTGASVTGRLLAQTAVNLDSAVVTQPAP